MWQEQSWDGGMEMLQKGGMAAGEVKEASSCGNEGLELSLKG